jgi:single-strand DNA-binding protein
MSTLFFGEGNLGGDAEFHEFPNPDDTNKPYRLLRARVYFDNPVRQPDGTFRDRGGYWTTVELWHSSAEQWAKLFRKGMRVVVHGKALIEEWTDNEGEAQVSDKVDAKLMAILPHRIEAITLAPKSSTSAEDSSAEAQREL